LPSNDKIVVGSEGSFWHTSIIKESDVINMLEEELGHKSDSSSISQADEHYEKVWNVIAGNLSVMKNELVHDYSPDSIRTDYITPHHQWT
jgi:hypothetical protein